MAKRDKLLTMKIYHSILVIVPSEDIYCKFRNFHENIIFRE